MLRDSSYNLEDKVVAWRLVRKMETLDNCLDMHVWLSLGCVPL